MCAMTAYQREAIALLVLTGWAIPGASNREASNLAKLHAFFISISLAHIN